jgi:hypothetical protein
MNLKVGRELDIIMAQEVLGHEVAKNKKFGFVETTPLGTRPMKKYSKDIEAAWEIALHLGVTLLPIQDGTWFAMIGPERGWESPAQFYKYMQDAQFMRSGAAVAESGPLAICLAAYQAVQRRQTSEAANSESTSPAH